MLTDERRAVILDELQNASKEEYEALIMALHRAKQKALPVKGSYRIEARGFCTQPAHAVRGEGDLLVSTFEFAGPVAYEAAKN